MSEHHNGAKQVFSLNHYVFAGSRNAARFLEKPSRDEIYKKILTPKDLNKPKFQEKGLIFVWPLKRTSFYYNKELVWVMWFLAHALHWLHVAAIWPSGIAVPLEQPPWNYDEPPLTRPKSRDFIIEPDWDGGPHLN